jgi:hypothetical protein
VNVNEVVQIEIGGGNSLHFWIRHLLGNTEYIYILCFL